MRKPEPEYATIEEGIFCPRGFVGDHDLVYDRDAKLVEESCLWRHHNLSLERGSAPKELPSEVLAKVRPRDEDLVFMGHQFIRNHHGHFLTEGISRYWYPMVHSMKGTRIPVYVGHGTYLRTFLRAFVQPQRAQWKLAMNAVGLSWRDLRPVTVPVRGRRIVVPECSMYNHTHVSPMHIRVTRHMAKSIIGEEPSRRSEPVYLSRRLLSGGTKTYLGEAAVEDYCRSVGCQIVYPERLSIREQIILFNAHDIFIGCIGSAFHNVLYRFCDRPAVNVYICSDEPDRSFELIDATMANQSHWIQCVAPLPYIGASVEMDSQAAIDRITSVLQATT